MTKQELIQHIDAALAEIQHLAEPPANYAAACGVAEAVLSTCREFLSSHHEPKALLSDMGDELIRELHRQGMVTMQLVFDGSMLRIAPDQQKLPNGLAVSR